MGLVVCEKEDRLEQRPEGVEVPIHTPRDREGHCPAKGTACAKADRLNDEAVDGEQGLIGPGLCLEGNGEVWEVLEEERPAWAHLAAFKKPQSQTPSLHPSPHPGLSHHHPWPGLSLSP